VKIRLCREIFATGPSSAISISHPSVMRAASRLRLARG
jgi:hypothetical protein